MPKINLPSNKTLLKESGINILKIKKTKKIIMNNRIVEDSARWDKAISISNIGWWEADYEKEKYTFSDFAARLLGLNEGTNEISFQDFQQLLPEEYRNLFSYTNLFYKNGNEMFEQRVPVHTPNGKIWILLRATCAQDGNHFTGMIQPLSKEESSYMESDSGQRLERMLYWQTSISNALLVFLQEKDTVKAIQMMLKELLVKFNADHTYIIEFESNYTYEKCIYEVSKEEHSTLYQKNVQYTIDKSDWWNSRLTAGIPIISGLWDIPTEGGERLKWMESRNISSVILLPLLSDNGTWGYAGIEFITPKSQWKHDEHIWFTSIANILSICLKLRHSIEEAEKKQQYVEWLLSSIPAGIELYNAEGTLIEVNDKDAEIFGVEKKEDLLGINLFEHPLANKELRERIRLGETIDLSFNYSFDKMVDYYQTPQKGTRALITKIMPLHNNEGKITNYLILVIDNTETQNAQSRIIEFEEFFALAGDYAKVGYARYDLIKEEGYASDSWYLNVGEPKDKPLKELFISHESVHPEDGKEINRFLEEARKGTLKKFRENLRIHRGNNQYTWSCVNLLVRDYRPEEGIIELVCINYDITDMKEMEEKLIEAKNHAETLDQLKSAFLANMSHEIRTPLNAIVGFADLLAETEDKDERLEYMTIVRENNDLLLQLISDILDLSKIEAGTFDFVFGDVDVNRMFDEIALSYKIKVPEGVKLLRSGHQEECHLHSDKNRLTQVITNFINNALKFTSRGSITLGYTITPENKLHFYVTDTGTGISAEKASSIFDRFVKLDSFVQGTGLGLSICKSIVEQLGGTIGVDSEQGVGSTFWFTIPWVLPESNDVCMDGLTPGYSPIPTNAYEKSHKLRILIVEDNPSNYFLLTSILRKDYELKHAENGEKGVEMYRSWNPDLILMDIKMPVMDGLTATRLIRKEDKEIPIIIITAFAFEQDKVDALQAGCNDFLPKPINNRNLKNLITKWTANK